MKSQKVRDDFMYLGRPLNKCKAEFKVDAFQQAW